MDENLQTVLRTLAERPPFGSQLHHGEFVHAGVAAIGTRDVQTNRFDQDGS
jgi:hypothetical protein